MTEYTVRAVRTSACCCTWRRCSLGRATASSQYRRLAAGLKGRLHILQHNLIAIAATSIVAHTAPCSRSPNRASPAYVEPPYMLVFCSHGRAAVLVLAGVTSYDVDAPAHASCAKTKDRRWFYVLAKAESPCRICCRKHAAPVERKRRTWRPFPGFGSAVCCSAGPHWAD